MDKFILILSLLFVCNWQVKAENFQLKSPNGTIQVTINWEGGQLKYKVESNGEELIAPSLIGMNTNAFGIKDLADVKKVTNSNGHEDYTPVWGTTQRVSESFNTTTIEFEKDFSIEFRAYDCGIAWRFISKSGKEIVVVNEVSEFNLNKGNTVFFPETDDFSTPFEPNYIPINIEKVAEQKLGLTPVLIKSPKGQAMVITDVNVKNYPGMFVHMSRSGLNATFPAYPSKEKEQFLGRLRLTNIPQLSKMLVVETEGYIAKTKGTNQFPWRAILIETTEKELLTNSLVEALADKPVSDNDFTWVKPGKVVWDWYHNWKFDDVNFKPGINTETYRYMIDFAVENNIEYVNIDDGWSGLHNFNKINKKLDLDEVLAYAKQKEIGIFLWCTWQTLEENLQENLDYFQQLGVAGLKVDFFDRCDQKVVDFVNQLGEECAQRKLLLNLHGMYKPTGLHVTYPNMVNFEGVMGLEYNKFSYKCTPTHNVTMPFVRNVVGPMDYTPGSMRYVDSVDFKKSWTDPHSMTTRTQQMAMYVVYHGGVQMLADSPTLYKKDSVVMELLRKVPVDWDESVALDGAIGEYMVMARRSGEHWYIAGINSNTEREISLNLDFLDKKDYNKELYLDGDTKADIRFQKDVQLSENNLKIYMKPAGGFILHLF